jgi:ribonuclease HII
VRVDLELGRIRLKNMAGFRRARFIRERFGVSERGFALCGMDEVGRGAFAGPLVAAGVVFPSNFRHKWLRDSKLLSALQREVVDQAIREKAGQVKVIAITVAEINEKGLGWANKEVFRRLVEEISADGYCCDGNLRVVAAQPVHSLVRGDALIPEIAAASIVAKVFRDQMMRELGEFSPVYGWGDNKGYGTGAHLGALAEYGAHAEHREVFVRNWRAKTGAG